ncbi:hypothetical protein ACFUPZ_05050 [Microbacterium oxydans]|uniref:hypothetical protein n=1 Tax=Microbacterium oxydans TaxID=82380 RepID=UPI00363535CE
MADKQLAHRDGCDAERVDITPHEEEGITTLHCLDCGSHAAFDQDGAQRPEPTAVGPLAGIAQASAWATEMTPAGARPRMNNQKWSNHA